MILTSKKALHYYAYNTNEKNSWKILIGWDTSLEADEVIIHFTES